MSTTRTGSVRIRAHCECGGSFDASSTPPRVAEDCHRIFVEVHADLGHRPCDAKPAAKARRQERRALAAGEPIPATPEDPKC